MDIWAFFSRTVLIYFVVFVMLRIMGKREIGKLSIFDLVISIMIAEIAVFVIEDVHRPLYEGLIPMITLVCIQILIALVSLKSQTLRELFDGQPSFIIRKGRLNRREMRRQRYTLNDLMLQLRQNHVSNVSDVEFAILETTGKLTVVKKEEANAGGGPRQGSAAKDDSADGRVRYEGLPLPLIMDGKVQEANLQKIGKTRFWLKNELQGKGVHDVKEVFFCTIDHRGLLFVDKKK